MFGVGKKKAARLGIVTAGVMVIMLLFSSSSVVCGDGEEAYTCERLQEIAAGNNMQKVIDELDIKAKQTALEDALEDARMLGDAYGRSAVLDNRITREIKPFEAETDLEAAKLTKDDHVRSLKTEIYNIYMEILLAKKELEKETVLLEILEEKYSIVTAEHEAGTVTEDAKDSARYNIDNKQVKISSINQKLLSYDLDLKLLLNIPLDGEPLDIEGTLETGTFRILDAGDMVDRVVSADVGIYRKERALEAKKMMMEIVEELYDPGVPVYDDNRLAYETAEMEYAAARADIEADIRNRHNDLLSKEDSLELAGIYEALMAKKLEIAAIRLESGLIGREEYLSAREKLIEAGYSVPAAVRDYNICAMKLEKDSFQQ